MMADEPDDCDDVIMLKVLLPIENMKICFPC